MVAKVEVIAESSKLRDTRYRYHILQASCCAALSERCRDRQERVRVSFQDSSSSFSPPRSSMGKVRIAAIPPRPSSLLPLS
jgi:hypothetical protein